MCKKISLIVPCYNEEVALPIFYVECNRILQTLDYDYEYLFINDGSNDGTPECMKKLACEDRHIKYISFSRNFGKEAAMYAGFCNADGDYVAVLDADMQDPPSLLPEMLRILETEEYDSVATRRVSRVGEPHIRSWFARKFYQIINRISDIDIVDGARDFRLMKREMVNAIVMMGEQNRFSKGIFSWIGFRTYWLTYENVKRVAGETKWSFWKLFKYAIDGIIDFSQVPLNIASWSGILLMLCSFVTLLFIIIRWLVFGGSVAGWVCAICVVASIGGIQLVCLGIIGKYIAKTYIEVRNRPHYIISESNQDGIKWVK